MSGSKFKIGDVVLHKTTDKFKMSIISNGRYTPDDWVKGTNPGDINPNSFICKYYNPDTNQWEQKQFYDTELSLSK